MFDPAGMPVLRDTSAGEVRVRPWPDQPAPLVLEPPGRQGEDRLRLRFSINTNAELELESTDLRTGLTRAMQRLGRVR